MNSLLKVPHSEPLCVRTWTGFAENELIYLYCSIICLGWYYLLELLVGGSGVSSMIEVIQHLDIDVVAINVTAGKAAADFRG